MGFDVDDARKHYSDDEIAQYLSSQSKFDYTGAVKSGYSPSEIIAHLAPKVGVPTTTSAVTPPPLKEDLSTDTVDAQPGGPPPSLPEYKDQMKKKGKDFVDNLKEHWPAMVGATAMGLVGAPITIPAAVGLATVGGAGGAGIQDVVRELKGSKEAPKTSIEAAKHIASEGAVQGAGELGGRVVAGLINRGAAPFAESVSPEAVMANEELKKEGGQLTAGQIAPKSTVLAQAESAARGSMTAAGKFHAFDAKNEAALKTIGQKLSDKLSQNLPKMTADERGALFADTISKGNEAHKMAAKQLFNELDDTVYAKMQLANPEEVNPNILPGVKGTTVAREPSLMGAEPLPDVIPTQKPSVSGYVNLSPVKDMAADVNAAYSRIAGIGKSDVGGTLLDRMAKLPDTVNFGDAQELRSQLLSLGRDLSAKGGESKALMNVQKAASLVDSQMETAAKNMGGDILDQWRGANKFWKFGKDYFNNDFIQKVALSGDIPAERVGEKIFSQGNVQQVVQARNALRAADYASKNAIAKGIEGVKPVNFDQVWPQMKAGYYESLLNNSTKSGTFDADNFFKTLNNEKVGRTLSAALPKEEHDAVMSFANTAKMVQSRPQENSRNLFRMGERGAILAGAAAPFSPGAAGKLIGAASATALIVPSVLAKMLTSPKTVNWLTLGLKTPITSPFAAGIVGRITAAMVQAQSETASQESSREDFKKQWEKQ